MMATIKNMQWTDKVTISRHLVFAAIIVLLLIILWFKLKPYTAGQRKIVIHNKWDSSSTTARSRADAQARAELSRSNLDTSHSVGRSGDTTAGTARPYGASHGGRHSSTTVNSQNASRVLERPLFDNMTVTLSAVLVSGITTTSQSESGGLGVEARVTGMVAGDATPMDFGDAAVNGASLQGVAAPQFQLKKMNLQFTEFVAADGKRYPVMAVAIDPETKALGVNASYSSGIASRLLGVTIGRALQTTDQFVTSRVLENTGDADSIRREFTRQSLEATQQPTNELNQEVTRDLRETRAVLSLSAGTPLLIRLKAAAPGSGRLRL